MDKDIIEGQAKQVQGKVIDAKGDLTNNSDDDIRGKAKVAEGKIQEGFGRVKEAVRDELDKDEV